MSTSTKNQLLSLYRMPRFGWSYLMISQDTQVLILIDCIWHRLKILEKDRMDWSSNFISLILMIDMKWQLSKWSWSKCTAEHSVTQWTRRTTTNCFASVAALDNGPARIHRDPWSEGQKEHIHCLLPRLPLAAHNEEGWMRILMVMMMMDDGWWMMNDGWWMMDDDEECAG